MRNKNKILFSIITTLSLIACDNNAISSFNQHSSSSSSTSKSTFVSSSISSSFISSSSEESNVKGKVYFEDLDELFIKLYSEEVYNSSQIEIKEIETANSIKNVLEENFLIYSDSTSSSNGTIIQTIDDKVTKEENFSSRKTTSIDKIEVNGIVNDYNMFIFVKDYQNDSFPNYVDIAEKLYIVNSKEEASQAGLEDDQYVLPSEIGQYCSAQINPSLYELIGINLISNPYALQAGAEAFDYCMLDDGNLYYSCKVNYNVDGDLDDIIYTTIEYSFVTNKEQTRLLNLSCSRFDRDVSNIDSEDVYETKTMWEVNLNYNERASSIDNLLNVNDYFLENINDIQLFINSSGKKYVDSNKVPSSATYLFAEAKEYSPSKSVNIGISNYSSSNSSIIALENGYFVIKDKGTVELSFVYYGKDEDGIYREKYFTKSVIVTNSYPQSIRILNSSPSIVDDTLEIGVTYTLNMFVGPDTKTDQSIQIISNSAEDVLTAVVNKSNDVEITTLKAGTVTIVIASLVDETIYLEKTYTVAPDLDYSTIIVEKDYYCSYTGGNYTASMNFNSDGIGQLVLHPNDGTEDIVYTFEYTINKRIITFTSWCSDVFSGCKMDYATITDEGKKITGEVESYYKSMEFNEVEE